MPPPVVPGDPRVLTGLLAAIADSCGAQGCELLMDGNVVAQVRSTPQLSVTAGVDLSWDHARGLLQLLDTPARVMSGLEQAAFRGASMMLAAFLRHAAQLPQADSELSGKVQSALEYLNDALILISGAGVVEFVNSAFEQATGKSRSALVGRPFIDCLPSVAGSRFESEARLAATSRKAHTFEAFSDRLGKWFECRAFPCRDGLIILLIDITARKADEATRLNLEDKLVRAQRMESLGTLAGGIAHDFNNILAAILGHAGMAADDSPKVSPLREHMEQIRRAGLRARELVEKILVFARGGGEALSRLPLRPLVQEAADLLQATLPPSVRLSVTLDEEDCAATVGAAEVQQMVLNLCTNAWQAMPGGQGLIRLQLRCVTLTAPRVCTMGELVPTKYAELSVEDNGGGMSAEVQARLFEPFFTTKPRGQGTGLGLHVLKGIVGTHSGAIDVVSEAGHGTRFSVYLPVVETEGEPVSAAAVHEALQPGHGEPVAYVDDDPIVLMMVERLLAKAGFSVSAFASPEACLLALMATPAMFKVLVTDFNMPNMNGAELAEAVRALSPGLPIVVTTGYVSEDLSQAALRMGNMAILHKERSYEELAEVTARALQGFPDSRFGETGMAAL
ncbi:hybrid sensor histidine kinase/response regulator [Roseateles amylovorans]|uniref:histidine kinase n=1 Tax=Roseateles amylovorans TaxID=2978473 RepID=A0ABY6B168_9BURK|nr:ATP-binding protein [Roseateles amylovorans]UXH79137.1 ATP-binding protein [Roseateles amylovorans]